MKGRNIGWGWKDGKGEQREEGSEREVGRRGIKTTTDASAS